MTKADIAQAGRTIPSNSPTRRLRAFTGNADHPATSRALGNPCLIHLAERAPDFPPPSTAITQCVTWAETSERANVRCWTPSGVEIQLCGHGLLCCAGYWRDRWDQDGVLDMNGTEVQCGNSGDVVWVCFPTLQTQDCKVPEWAGALLRSLPVQASEAGSANGYLVLEMPAACDIASLAAPGIALGSHTQRSLIVTREVNGDDSLCGESIQYRYFAPQHGVPEDTATGSAMRVLAAYWQRRGAGDELKALQRSADGGWLASRIENDRTWIGGNVVEDREAA